MKNIFKVVAVALAVISVNSFTQAKVFEKTAAMVNKKVILESELDETFTMALMQYSMMMPQVLNHPAAKLELKKKLLDQMIDKELILQSAKEKNIVPTEAEINQAITGVKENFAKAQAQDGKPLTAKERDALFDAEMKRRNMSFEKFRKNIKEELTVNKYIQKEIFAKVLPPEDKQLKSLYGDTMQLVKGDETSLKNLTPQGRQSRQMLAKGFADEMAEKVRVSHILLKLDVDASTKEKTKAKNKAFKILKETQKKDADFAELAKKYSEDEASKPRGGDLGFILRGWMPKEFEKYAFSYDVGKIAGPVKTDVGYHILKVTEKKAKKTLKYDEVKNELFKFSIVSGRQVKMAEVLKNLRNKAVIKITYKFELPKPKKMTKPKKEVETSEKKTEKPSTKKADKN